MSSLYSLDILRLATSVPYQTRLEVPGASAERRATPCGSRVVVDITLDDQGIVTGFGQQVNACALGQASAAVLGAHVIGQTAETLAEAVTALTDYLERRRADPGDWPGLGVFAAVRDVPARHVAIRLPFEVAAEAARLACSR